MKAYRFELREEIKWQWGFWGLYGFSYISLVVIAVLIDRPLMSWVGMILCLLMLLIISLDIVGYKIKRKRGKNNDRQKRSKMF